MENSPGYATPPVGGPSQAPPPGSSLSTERRQVTEILRAADGPMTVDQLAEQLGKHANTARHHLDALVDADVVERQLVHSPGRGRPAWSYRLRDEAVPAADYAALVEVLAGAVGRLSDEPAAEGRRLGAEWGRRLVPREPRPTLRQTLVPVFESMGYGPRPGRRADTVRLTTCPVLEAARANPDVVCGIHQGIVDALSSGFSPDASAELTPFATPSACLLQLHPSR